MAKKDTTTPVDEDLGDTPVDEPVADDANDKPGEAGGAKTSEIKAAEKHPDSAKQTNPVAEATGAESKDPYAEGQTIANPEPNNGLGEDAEEGKAKLEKEDEKEEDRLDEASASTVEEGQDIPANK